MPHSALEYLQALTLVTGKAEDRIIQEAIESYANALDDDRRELVQTMIRRESEKAGTRPRREPRDGQPILCVDDNEAMLFARATVLRREGFHVVEARSGRQALKLLETMTPALVLVDVNLPDMSGLDVARQIKSDPRFAAVKVIQISATFGSPRDQLHGLEIGGADMYLAEPVQRGMLLSAVQRLLER